MKTKKVLIAGGLGFVGSNIAQKLVQLGAEVTILDACLDPYGWNLANIKEISSQIEFIQGDTRDLPLMKQAVREKDVVFDCAGQISHNLSMKEPLLDIDINCRGALNVLEAVRMMNPTAKLVYAGTRGQIGRMVYSPIDENHPTNPMDMNGINKLAAEKYYMLYYQVHGIKTTSLRINNSFGPRCQMKHDDYGVINWFIRRALLKEPIIIHGQGLQTRDYNYIEDVAEAMILAAQSDKADGQIFMLGSGKETRMIDMIQLILDTVGWQTEIEKIPRPMERESIEIGNFVVSIEKIKNTLGWYSKTSLEEGIKKTVDFYRLRLDEYIGR